MSVYQPRWRDWTPKEGQPSTDKTDKSHSETPKPPSVSFVSAISGRIQGGAVDAPSPHEGNHTPPKTPLTPTDKTDKSPLLARVVLLQVPAHVPVEWCQGVADLLAAPTHPAWTEETWKALQDDALTFLRGWASQAHGLGWEALDLFGAYPTASVARVDGKGLVLLLQGRPVVALTEDSAVIKTVSGGSLTFRKHPAPPAGRQLVWNLQ